MQTCRRFLGLTLANTQVICKEMNCNRATLNSSSSCSQEFQPTITASPTHSQAPQYSQSGWLRTSETAVLYFNSRARIFLQRAALTAFFQVRICSEGLPHRQCGEVSQSQEPRASTQTQGELPQREHVSQLPSQCSFWSAATGTY